MAYWKLFAPLALCSGLSACFVPDINSDWMADYQDRRLGELTWVQSHDAGMHRPSETELSACKGGAFFNISVTQRYDLLGQLKSGARKFDIRPVLHNEKLYTAHGTKEHIDALGLSLNAGCHGQGIDELFTQVHDFLQLHPTEVVMLDVSHIEYMVGMFSDASATDVAEQVKLSAEKHLGDLLFRPSTFPTLALKSDLWNMQLADFVAANQRVIITTDCDYVDASRGFIGCASAQQHEPVPVSPEDLIGSWLNSPFPADVMTGAEAAYRNYLDASPTQAYEMSWTATQDQNCVASSIVYKLFNRSASALPDIIKQVLQKAGVATEGYEHCRSIQSMSQPLKDEFAAHIDTFKDSGLFCAQRRPRVISMDFVDGDMATTVIKLNDPAQYPETGVCDGITGLSFP